MSQATAVIMTQVPIELHKEVKRIAKRRKNSIIQFTRDALEVRVEYFKAKEKEDQLEKQPASKRAASEITPLEQRPPVEIVSTPVVDRVSKLFEDHAARIAAVYNQPAEVKARTLTAFEEIRRFAPISYGDDHKIERRLEALIADRAIADEPAPLIVQSMMTQPPPVAEEPSQALGKMFAAFKQIMAPAVAEPDPLIGKTLDLASIKKQSVLSDGNE